MKNLKTRQKFLFSGTLAFISLIFLGLLSYGLNKNNYYSLGSLFADFSEAQDVQSMYITPLFIIREKTLMIKLDTDALLIKQLQQEIIAKIEILDYSLNNLPPEINSLWQQYKNEILSIKKIYTINETNEKTIQNLRQEQILFFHLINAIEKHQEDLLLDSERTFLQSLNLNISNSNNILIGFILIGFISFILNIYVIFKVVKNIEQVEKGLMHFFHYLQNPRKQKGNLHINVSSSDELGHMAKAINEQVMLIKQTLDNDYKLIEEATLLVKELQEEHFGKRLTSTASSEELKTLKQVMNMMIDSLEEKISNEVKERLSQEQILIQQSKLAAMGTMLGNIAHQWRQPISEISAILMNIEIQIRLNQINHEKFLQYINLCNKITEHMSNTINDFQSFFQPSKDKEYFDICEECHKAVAIISASFIAHNILLEFQVEKQTIVYGYPREFAHSILNILSNAKDILLERKIKQPKVIFHIKSGKEYTVIHIEDNGGGIKLDNLDIIFEPYFTTKYASQGTGIGLHMAKTMIEKNMNGFLNVKNTECGACFTIKIK